MIRRRNVKAGDSIDRPSQSGRSAFSVGNLYLSFSLYIYLTPVVSIQRLSVDSRLARLLHLFLSRPESISSSSTTNRNTLGLQHFLQSEPLPIARKPSHSSTPPSLPIFPLPPPTTPYSIRRTTRCTHTASLKIEFECRRVRANTVLRVLTNGGSVPTGEVDQLASWASTLGLGDCRCQTARARTASSTATTDAVGGRRHCGAALYTVGKQSSSAVTDPRSGVDEGHRGTVQHAEVCCDGLDRIDGPLERAQASAVCVITLVRDAHERGMEERLCWGRENVDKRHCRQCQSVSRSLDW